MNDLYREHIELKITHKSTIRRYTSEISALKKKIAELEEKIRNPFTPVIHDASLEELLCIVANVTNQLPENIIGKNRTREYAIARQMFCFIATRHLGYKLERVGLFLNRHHSTIIHGANRINDAIDLKFNPELRIYEKCMQELRSMSETRN